MGVDVEAGKLEPPTQRRPWAPWRRAAAGAAAGGGPSAGSGRLWQPEQELEGQPSLELAVQGSGAQAQPALLPAAPDSQQGGGLSAVAAAGSTEQAAGAAAAAPAGVQPSAAAPVEGAAHEGSPAAGQPAGAPPQHGPSARPSADSVRDGQGDMLLWGSAMDLGRPSSSVSSYRGRGRRAPRLVPVFDVDLTGVGPGGGGGSTGSGHLAPAAADAAGAARV